MRKIRKLAMVLGCLLGLVSSNVCGQSPTKKLTGQTPTSAEYVKFYNPTIEKQLKFTGWMVEVAEVKQEQYGCHYGGYVKLRDQTFAPCSFWGQGQKSPVYQVGDVVVLSGRGYFEQDVPANLLFVSSAKKVYTYLSKQVPSFDAVDSPMFLSIREVSGFNPILGDVRGKFQAFYSKESLDQAENQVAESFLKSRLNITSEQSFQRQAEPMQSTFVLRRSGEWEQYQCVLGHFFKFDRQNDRVTECDQNGSVVVINPEPIAVNPINRNGPQLK